MLSFINKKEQYIYCGDKKSSLLAKIIKGSTESQELQILAEVEQPCDEAETVKKLLQSASISPGSVSLSFPLHFFQIVSLSIPMVPDAAIERAIPYHLSKSVDKPVGDYVYDWQVSKRHKDQLTINVYLFPKETFQDIRREFGNCQLEVTHFEPDVFSAIAYLDDAVRLAEEDATLCAVVWADSLNFAVCEAGRLVLCRTTELAQPEEAHPQLDPADNVEESLPAEQAPLVEPEEPEQKITPEQPTTSDSEKPQGTIEMKFEVDPIDPVATEQILPEETIGSTGDDNILAGFNIFSDSNEEDSFSDDQLLGGLEIDQQTESVAQKSELEETGPVVMRTAWDDYIDNIILEVLRTRDYYSKIIKGKAIKKYFLLGADPFFEKVEGVLSKSVGEEVNLVIDKDIPDNIIPVFHAIGIGTALR